ncbi:sensor histidine kinase [Rheinheimera mangrovi]|uniref:sensor histidine kinase n=1 Tax=Rheinheimera mangrovi TaxID=2498451 RepID=UPI000F8DFB05|nr:histidine kinase [Rheinheimera mangrovi]
MKQLKTFFSLLLFSYGLMLYLALLQTAPGQPLLFHADAPLWLTLQAALSLWLSRTLDARLWTKHTPTSLLQRYSQSFALSMALFVGLMTVLQLVIDLATSQPLVMQQYLRVSLMYLLVHSLIAGADLLWQALKRQQQQQLELLQAQQHNQQFKLQLLQQQLDPHFLFNNLNVLSVLIHKSPDQAEQFLDHFADIYRYQLQQGSKTLVPLADELAFAQQYMTLLAQRFPASFQLKSSVEPEQQTNYQLVPCSLQLLLENAVKHNSASAEQPLLIQLELQQGQLIVRHPLRTKAYAQPGTGTGLSNLSERCQTVLGKPIEVTQNDEFIVSVPLQQSV